ncbi:MAG: putative DNA-binding domain-containing protein [Bacillota bacterium]
MTMNDVPNLFNTSSSPNDIESTLRSQLQPAGRLSVEQAFEFYHQGYISRLTEVLSETFESVRRVIGVEHFNNLCAQYIESHPSTSYNLNKYGHRFPQFLVTTALGKEWPFIEDLAHFEWIFKELANAPTPDPLPTERIQEFLGNDDFKVTFVEAMRIFQSHYSLQGIWRARHEALFTLKNFKWNQPESLLLFKKEDGTHVISLDPIEAEILLELQEGRSISQALADFANLMSPQKTTKLLHLMMKAGIIDDIS